MFRTLLRIVFRLGALAVLVIGVGVLLWRHFESEGPAPLPQPPADSKVSAAIARLDAAFAASWQRAGVAPSPPADVLTLARRLSLALTGAPPSLEEIRRLETLPPGSDPVEAWLAHLLSDRRSADYLAERFARVFVGVETGPFLVYRRRHLVNWLADQIAANRPYDAIVRDLVASEGLWTTRPETNFITVSIVQDGDKDRGPDEIKLAARTSRAFLGVSLDCVQCHDDKFGDRWKQQDFHQLAAFFAQANTSLTGLHDDRKVEYATRYLGQKEDTKVAPAVPFAPDLLPEQGSRRERLAHWITADLNAPFARATVNRTWALLFGKPLVEPVDDLPLDGPWPAGLEVLADEFVASGHDFRHLVRVIAGSAAFARESRSEDPSQPVTAEQEQSWAAFPVTPLRPEQVAGSIIQSSTLQAIDHSAHFLQKLRRFGETRDFVKRYGDPGEEKFVTESGTIPQRLLLMNGKLVRERTQPNPLLNASSRLANQSSGDRSAIEGAFLATLTRYPDETELDHFTTLLAGKEGQIRDQTLSGLCWSLINCTEFSWNR